MHTYSSRFLDANPRPSPRSTVVGLMALLGAVAGCSASSTQTVIPDPSSSDASSDVAPAPLPVLDAGADGRPPRDAGPLPDGAREAGPVFDAGREAGPMPDAGRDTGAASSFRSIDWQPATKLSDAGTALGFTQTYLGGRDDTGTLHVVWSKGATAVHGTLPKGSTTWSTKNLPRLGAGRYGNVGLGIVQKGTFVALWHEVDGTTATLVAARTKDYGANWDPPIELAKGSIGAVTSLHTFVRSSGADGASVCWFDESDLHVRTRTWKGTGWTASDWTDAVTLSSGFAGESKDCTVGGAGDLVVASWEWKETGVQQKKLMLTRSVDGGGTWEKGAAIAAPDVEPSSQDASFAVDADGALWIAFQGMQKVFASKSTDLGKTFSKPAELGPGLFVKVASNNKSELAFTWEHFEGGGTKDDKVKRVGLSLTTTGLAPLAGPFAMPDSDTQYGLYYPYVMLSDAYVDVFWLDTNTGNELYYRGGSIVRQ